MTRLLHRRPHSAPAAAADVVFPPLPRQAAPVAAPRPGRSGRAMIYGCFSCPWCYVASLHSDQLTDQADGLQWRMVVPDPHLPVTGLRLDRACRSRLDAELTAVSAALLPGEELPEQAPAFLPHTGPAVAGYAEADGAGVGGLVRRVLFDAYWQHGADIGNPEVLRRLLVEPILAGHSTSWPLRESGYAVTLAGGPITTTAYCHMRDWRHDWQHAAGSALPAMVDDSGTVTGQDVLHALRATVLTQPSVMPVPLSVGPATPAWIIATNTEASFLSTRGRCSKGPAACRRTGLSDLPSANLASRTAK